MLGGKERRPSGDAFESEKKMRLYYMLYVSLLYVSRCYSSAVITFSGFLDHWIIYARFIS